MVGAVATQISWEFNPAKTLSLLKQCSNLQELQQVHAQMFKTGLVQDSMAASKLMTLCISLDSGNFLPHAKLIFDSIGSPNTFMCNAMLRGYSNSEEPDRALDLYHQMLCHSIPHNSYTFPFLLKACANLSAFEVTKQLHAQIITLGFSNDIYATNSLIHAYAMTRNIESARLLFNSISKHDTVSWNSMINGYSKCGEMQKALEVFRNMPEKNLRTWTSMISGYVQAGMNKEALELFHEMQLAGMEPDNISLTNALSACAQLGALEQGKWIHEYVEKSRIRKDSVMGCVLVDMYAKCGDIDKALNVFAKLKGKCVHVWTALISGLAFHGYGQTALKQFMHMQEMGIKPNLITFTAVLTACSYSGLVQEGKLVFESMDRNFNLKPTIEHYGCMVDLLGRAGLLKEARDLIEQMPLKPNAVIWGALLKACRVHKNHKLGQEIGEMLIELDPYHGGRYIHLANIHAMCRKWDQAAKTRNLMKQQGIFKVPGYSAICLNGEVHKFLAGDKSHPEINMIQSEWNKIKEKVRRNGYTPALVDLLLDLDDEEKEAALDQHSEKLAITYALIKTKPGTTIRISKNLRVCEDCHNVTKFISKIYGREIVMRDRNRFHHVRDGKCSCGDYW